MTPQVPRARFDAIKAKIKAATARKAKRAAKAAVLWPKPARAGLPRPAKAPTARQRLRSRLDRLWADCVKKRGNRQNFCRCERCWDKPIQVAYHIQPRGDDATRWDLDNGIGTCAACNWWEKKNRGRRTRDFHISMFGIAKVERLEAKARTKAHFSMADLQQIYDDLAVYFSRIGRTLDTGAEQSRTET